MSNILDRLNEIEKHIADSNSIEMKIQECSAMVDFIINNPAPNRNIHDFENGGK